jgi:hypothetical protein
MQRRILEALDPSQQVCRRWEPHAACIPEYCYGWLSGPSSPVYAQLPLWVYDLDLVRQYLVRQEAPRWPACPLTRRSNWDERFVWAVSRFGRPNPTAFGVSIARALRTLIARGQLVPCTSIPLVRYRPDPLRKRPHPWVDVEDEETATLYYLRERRIRFVTRADELSVKSMEN